MMQQRSWDKLVFFFVEIKKKKPPTKPITIQHLTTATVIANIFNKLKRKRMSAPSLNTNFQARKTSELTLDSYSLL